jgi:hypothetical protein
LLSNTRDAERTSIKRTQHPEGNKIINPPASEDEDGRSDNERLVEEGIADAEHDRMRQANLKRQET